MTKAEDRADRAAVRRALKEPGPNTPLAQVMAELLPRTQRIMRRPNGSEPSLMVRLYLTAEEKAAIKQIAADDTRTVANVCTMLVKERLRERAKKRR